LVCDKPSGSDECFLNKCLQYPQIDAFKNELDIYFERRLDENLSYQRWTAIDRTCQMEVLTKPINEFIDEFCNDLPSLKTHYFIAKQQAAYLVAKKNALQPGELTLIGDFAENYACLVQNSVQQQYWSQTQVVFQLCIITKRMVRLNTCLLM
jgi:hypothetical protein